MNLQNLIQIRRNADSDIKAIKATAFDRMCAEIDRMEAESAETDELTPGEPPAVIEAPPAVIEEPPAVIEAPPAVIEAPPAAPQPAEDPGATIRRRGRPRKAVFEEPAPSLLPAPAPEQPPAQPMEPMATSPEPYPIEDDMPW